MRKIQYAAMVFACVALFLGSQCVSQNEQPSTLRYTPAPKVSSLTEPAYTQIIAKQMDWEAEVRTSIGTRCDLVSDTLAIEVEWPSKPYEAVGQSLSYAQLLDKQPAILFLQRDQSDRKFVQDRVGKVCDRLAIQIIWYDVPSKKIIQ